MSTLILALVAIAAAILVPMALAYALSFVRNDGAVTPPTVRNKAEAV